MHTLLADFRDSSVISSIWLGSILRIFFLEAQVQCIRNYAFWQMSFKL